MAIRLRFQQAACARRGCLQEALWLLPAGSQMNMTAAVGAAAMSSVGSKGRLCCVQLKDGDLGGLRRREANRGQQVFELLAGPPCTDALHRLPHPDQVQGTFADRAVVAQLSHASRTPSTHDQRMRPV